MLSTAATAAWGSYHWTCAASIVVAALPAGESPAILPAFALPDLTLAGCEVAFLFALGHLLLGIAHAGAALSIRRAPERAEPRVLAALAAGSGLAAGAFAVGLSSGQPGAYAIAMAATLLALSFDRAMATDGPDAFDERPLVREAMLVAARLGRRPEADGAAEDAGDEGAVR